MNQITNFIHSNKAWYVGGSTLIIGMGLLVAAAPVFVTCKSAIPSLGLLSTGLAMYFGGGALCAYKIEQSRNLPKKVITEQRLSKEDYDALIRIVGSKLPTHIKQ